MTGLLSDGHIDSGDAAAGSGATPRARGGRFLRAVRPAPLRVALVAPPWIRVPPPGYGGIELVVGYLAEGLVRRGHEVTLLAPPGTRSPARVRSLLDEEFPDRIGETLLDVDHVACALGVVDEAARRGRPFHVIHDHAGFTLTAFADRIDVPVLHTVHGPFTDDTRPFYRRHAAKVWLSALSRAQLQGAPTGVRSVGVIPNPIDLDAWPLERRKDPYVLWMGRMVADKGAHRAITAARQANVPLVVAGPVQPGQRPFFDAEIAPHVDGRSVRYVEEVGGERKRELFAHASALLMPIRWPEPFGMVMVEAMACGTPVVAFPEGSVPEIVVDGESGFIVRDEEEMAAAIGRVNELDPERCRATVAERFAIDVVAEAYEDAYRQVIAGRTPSGATMLVPRVG
jgi:glycosyltransferase involved in cell wall biosynthesis